MKVEATHTLDVADLAREIEHLVGSYFVPYERGLYAPLCGFPVIRAGVNHEFDVVTRSGLVRYNGEELYANPDLISGDVYNADGNLVLASRSKALLKKSPYIPHRSLLLINLMIDSILIKEFAYSRKHNRTYGRDILLNLLDKTQGFGSNMDVETQSTFNEIYDAVDVMTLGLCNQVYELLDGYKHHMHTSKLRDNIIVIERHIDFRIHYFNVKTNEGESIDI